VSEDKAPLKPASEVVALVVDNGLFVDIARTLGRTFKKVYYCCPWINSFPKPHVAWVGKGFPEIEVIDDPFQVVDQIDLAVFPDIYFGWLQVHLERLGIAVWGGRHGDLMEIDRAGAKRVMKRAGLAVTPYVVVHGTAELRAYLQANDDKWVKISKWRGLMETFYSKNYIMIEPLLDKLEYELGAFKTQIDFLIENPIADALEGGIDTYSIDGQIPKTIMSGFEIKDEGYVGEWRPFDTVPEVITRYDRVMADVFKVFRYRGFYSTEVRVKDGTPYMIDMCSRCGSPPNELYQLMMRNLPEVVWQGANGILVDPEVIGKWGAEILIHSSWADSHWQPISIKKEFAPYLKLRNSTIIDGKTYVIPQALGLPEIGAVVGYGDTVESAIEMAKEIAETVEGYDVECKVESMDKATEVVRKAKESGVA
jgi:hypothetical protein